MHIKLFPNFTRHHLITQAMYKFDEIAYEVHMCEIMCCGTKVVFLYFKLILAN